MSRATSHPRSPSRDTQGAPSSPEHQDQQRDATTHKYGPQSLPGRAPHSRYLNLEVDFVCNFFGAIIRGALPIANWNESDYERFAVLVRGLEDRSLPLEALIWDPATSDTREKALAAQAVCACLADEQKKAWASDDEDIESDMLNDCVYLRGMFRLKDSENPYRAFDKLDTVPQMLVPTD